MLIDTLPSVGYASVFMYVALLLIALVVGAMMGGFLQSTTATYKRSCRPYLKRCLIVVRDICIWMIKKKKKLQITTL